MVAISLSGPIPDDAAETGSGVPLGCPVRDVDGAPVGTVGGIDAGHLVVEHGLFRRDLVPLAAVAGFDGTAIRLNVTKERVRRGDWEPPASTGSEEPRKSLARGY